MRDDDLAGMRYPRSLSWASQVLSMQDRGELISRSCPSVRAPGSQGAASLKVVKANMTRLSTAPSGIRLVELTVMRALHIY